MRRFLALLLTLVMIFACTNSVSAAPTNDSSESVSSLSASARIAGLAAEYLMRIRPKVGTSCTSLGFSTEAFLNMSVGTPFVVHRFNESGEVISDDVYMCPLVYENEVVGQLEIYYDPVAAGYCYALGTAYAEPLNNLMEVAACKRNDSFVFGSIGGKFFATDGTRVEILFDASITEQSVDVSQIEGLCKIVRSNADKNSIKINDIKIPQAETSQRDTITPIPGSQRLLAVPHVAQNGGVCGIAAWAAVLNYRFNTAYNTATLTSIMENGGYMDDDGLPTMSHYRDYANYRHNAGCVVGYSPPSFTTVEAVIDANKPIMGSWYTGTGSSKRYHAVIIVGYIENIFSYTYYVKNPVYTNTQMISVASSHEVLYVYDGSTWRLNQIVY